MFRMIPLLIALALPLGAAEPAASPEDLLRQGLYQEEANRDYDKAAENYRAVIAAHDRQRALAASATFRLGEIARKKGDKPAAIEAFRTLVTRFPEQADMVRLSRENLTALGAALPEGPAAPPPTADPADEETKEIERLMQLAKNSPDLIDGADEKGWRPVHYAALRGQVRVVGHLLENKASPSAPTVNEGFTPLHIACIKGHLGVVKALLAAKVGLEDGVSQTAKLGMIGEGNLSQLLAGNQSRMLSWGSFTALDLAALAGRREIVRTLLAAGADCRLPRMRSNLADDYNFGRQEIVSPNMPKIDLTVPLLPVFVALGRDARIASDLIKAGAPLESADANPVPGALTVAAMRNPKLVSVLLEAGANPNGATPVTGDTPLHAAAAGGNTDAARALLEAGADVNASDTGGFAPLHFATSGEMAKLLVEKGADLSKKSAQGDTPLFYQVRNINRTAVIEELIKAGSKVDDPIRLLNGTSDDNRPSVLRFVVQDRVYLQSAAADAISLMIHDSESVAFGAAEVRPAAGSPVPEIGDVLWRYWRSDEDERKIKRFTVMRRTEKGGYEAVYQWEAKQGVAEGPKCPRLAWGDVVEIERENDPNKPAVRLWDSVKEPAERTMTIRLEGVEFKRRFCKPEDCWLRFRNGELPTASMRGRNAIPGTPSVPARDSRARGARGMPQPDPEMLAFPPRFVDSARLTVMRKGMEKPVGLEFSDNVRPFLLMDGDVIDCHLDSKKTEEMIARKTMWLLRDDFSFGIEIARFGGSVPQSVPRPGASNEYSRFLLSTDYSSARLIRAGGGTSGSFNLKEICAEYLDPATNRAALEGGVLRESLRKKLPKFAPSDILVLPALSEKAGKKDQEQAAAITAILEALWRSPE